MLRLAAHARCGTPDALTINEAAADDGLVGADAALRRAHRARRARRARTPATGCTARPSCSGCGTLRELLDRFEVGLAEVGFALRLRREPELRVAVDDWLSAEPARPEHVAAADWLRFEQEKHQRLLAVATPSAAQHTTATSSTRTMEAA